MDTPRFDQGGMRLHWQPVVKVFAPQSRSQRPEKSLFGLAIDGR